MTASRGARTMPPGRMVLRLFTDGRRIKRTASVMGPLMRVVYSRLSDPEAVEEMRAVVRAHTDAVQPSLAYVEEVRDYIGGYIPDRAYRILTAAIAGREPEPPDPADTVLFARERELGWLPLVDALDRLARLVPELEPLRDDLACKTEGRGDSLVLEPRTVLRLIDVVGGPRSNHRDPLLRSHLAQEVVANAISCVEGRSDARDPHTPLFCRRQSRPA
jgi:hypothetical protein